MRPILKILQSGTRTYYIRDEGSDFHTELGFIRKEDLMEAKDGDVLTSNTGNNFFVFSPSFIDNYLKIKRGAQIIARKDVGIIITECGLNKTSKVLDAGAGSGALATFLAAVCKKVYSYEIREDFFALVKKNIEFLGLKNLTLKRKDIYEGIAEKDLDAIIFDLPEPWLASAHAKAALRPGGFLVSYSPSIPQVMDFLSALPEGMTHLKTVEIIEREWEISGRKVRPKTRQLGHTGFMSFTRKTGR